MDKQLFHLVCQANRLMIYLSSAIERPLVDSRGIVVSIEKIKAETVEFNDGRFQTDDPELLQKLLEANKYDESFQFVEPKAEVKEYIGKFSSAEPVEVGTETSVEAGVAPRRGRPPKER